MSDNKHIETTTKRAKANRTAKPQSKETRAARDQKMVTPTMPWMHDRSV